MLKEHKNYLKFAFLMSLVMGGVFLAGMIVAEEQSGFVYLFKLYYDKGQLFADRDFEFKYDLIAENYFPGPVPTAFLRGEVVAIGGKQEATFYFTPGQGKMTVKAPYFSDADIVNFYNPQGQKLLAISVRESAVCDNNGVCEEEVGEDKNNCAADCFPTGGLPKGEQVSPGVSPTTIPISGYLGNRPLLLISSAVGAIVLLFLTIWLWRKRKKHDLPPPQIQ